MGLGWHLNFLEYTVDVVMPLKGHAMGLGKRKLLSTGQLMIAGGTDSFVPKCDLLDPNREPTDQELNKLMGQVVSTANAKAHLANQTLQTRLAQDMEAVRVRWNLGRQPTPAKR